MLIQYGLDNRLKGLGDSHGAQIVGMYPVDGTFIVGLSQDLRTIQEVSVFIACDWRRWSDLFWLL